MGGHYNKTRTLTDNLKISLPILSRFDLVLVLLDQKVGHFRSGGAVPEQEGLWSRLRMGAAEAASVDPLPANALQKLLSFANRKLVPELSTEAKQVIKKYFLRLRERPFFSDSIPVTNRTLLSLVRLTWARAKIDLCRVATRAS